MASPYGLTLLKVRCSALGSTGPRVPAFDTVPRPPNRANRGPDPVDRAALGALGGAHDVLRADVGADAHGGVLILPPIPGRGGVEWEVEWAGFQPASPRMGRGVLFSADCFA